MNSHKVSFSGALLERGFWLYVWRVNCGASRIVHYVGRTGDSSSHNAASPFGRLSQHLDMREKATANMLLRHLRRIGIDPLGCHFELFAVGPMFPEQATLDLHRQFRDRIAPLEAALAERLRSCGLEVLGKHPRVSNPDPALLVEIHRVFEQALAVGLTKP